MFGEALSSLVMRSLADGVCQYLSRSGAVLADGVPVIIDSNVERFNEATGAVDRVRTHCVERARLAPFDRQGAFVVDGATWHIDGIASDDGQMITLYVVP